MFPKIVLVVCFIAGAFSAKGQKCVPYKSKLQLPLNISLQGTCEDGVSDELEHPVDDINILKTWKKFSQLTFLKYENVSESCHESLDRMMKGLENEEMWALKMADASAKLPSGLLSGNVNQYGHFDQCLEISEAQYCLAEIDFESSWSKNVEPFKNLIHSYFPIRGSFKDPAHRIPSFSIIRWGLCVPKQCTPEDVEKALAETFRADVYMRKNMCQVKNVIPFTMGDQIARLFFGAIIILILLSSICTYFDVQPITNSKNALVQVPMAFSFQNNWNRLVNVSSEESIRSLDGIRGFAALGLIVSHKYMSLLYNPFINRTQMAKTLTMDWAVLGRTAILYTDAFMLVSGLLSARSVINDIKKHNSMRLGEKIITRIFRITPNMVAMILFCTYILPRLGSGPMYPIVVNHHSELCKSYMWRNFFYVHNYFGFENMCLTHSHQVGIDMQLFLMTPILMYLVWKRTTLGFFLMGTVAVLSTILRFIVTYKSGISHVIYFGIPVSKMFDTANLSYILPTHRATIYLMGVAMAYVLREKYDFPRNKIEASISWIVALILGFGVLLGPVHTSKANFQHDNFDAALYGSLAPISCGLAICWLIYASNNEYGGWFGDLLTWKGFRIFSKISYAVYLTQFPIFFYNVGIRRHVEEYSPFLMIPETCFILLASTILTLCVEMPFITINNLLFKRKQGSGQESDSLKDKAA